MTKILSEADYKVHVQFGRLGRSASRHRKIFDVSASDKTTALNSLSKKHGTFTVHGIHDVSDAEKLAAYHKRQEMRESTERGSSAVQRLKRSHDLRMSVLKKLMSSLKDESPSPRRDAKIKRLRAENKRRVGVDDRQMARIKESRDVKTFADFINEDKERD